MNNNTKHWFIFIATSCVTRGHTTKEVCASEPRASRLPPLFPVTWEKDCYCQHILKFSCHWKAPCEEKNLRAHTGVAETVMTLHHSDTVVLATIFGIFIYTVYVWKRGCTWDTSWVYECSDQTMKIWRERNRRGKMHLNILLCLQLSPAVLLEKKRCVQRPVLRSKLNIHSFCYLASLTLTTVLSSQKAISGFPIYISMLTWKGQCLLHPWGQAYISSLSLERPCPLLGENKCCKSISVKMKKKLVAPCLKTAALHNVKQLKTETKQLFLIFFTSSESVGQ